MPPQPSSWADIDAGAFGIPQDATHFKWSLATAQRKKMCDSGKLYDLSDPYDRPGSKPTGIVHIYPYTVEGEKGQEQSKPVVCKSGIAGSDPVCYVVVEFAKAPAGENAMAELVGLLKVSIELNNKPTSVLTEHIARLQKTVDEQAEFISENEGGPISKFLSKNPEIVKTGADLFFDMGKTLGSALRLKVDLLRAEAESKGLIANKSGGTIDVTPKKPG